MGLSIIGGTIVSTLLTLFVVPAVYLMLENSINYMHAKWPRVF
jgi:multidrug efflux pump subunit AcrB